MKANMDLESHWLRYMSSDGYSLKEFMRTLIYISPYYLLSFTYADFSHGIKKLVSLNVENPAGNISNKQSIILSMAFRNICSFLSAR